jgi:hypothetical protein
MQSTARTIHRKQFTAKKKLKVGDSSQRQFTARPSTAGQFTANNSPQKIKSRAIHRRESSPQTIHRRGNSPQRQFTAKKITANNSPQKNQKKGDSP